MARSRPVRSSANILRKAHDFFRANKGKKLSTIPWARRPRLAEKADLPHGGICERACARRLSDRAGDRPARYDLYTKEEIDSVYIVFSEFKTVMTRI